MRHAHDAYLESRITSAEPVELIRVLYQTCMVEVREARRHLAAGDIAARAQSISKAYAVLTELSAALDHERGGEISLRLLRLYDYLQRKLIEANFKQSDAVLMEVLGLLATLLEAWDGVKARTQPDAPVERRWMPPPQEPAMAYSSNAWSF